MNLYLGTSNPDTAKAIVDTIIRTAREHLYQTEAMVYGPIDTHEIELSENRLVLEDYDLQDGSRVEVRTTSSKIDGSFVDMAITPSTEKAYIDLRNAAVDLCRERGVPTPDLYETEDDGADEGEE